MTRTYTTRTAELGAVTFSAPAADAAQESYVWIEADSFPRRQICYGGDFRGATVTATTETLQREARRWMRARRRLRATA